MQNQFYWVTYSYLCANRQYKFPISIAHSVHLNEFYDNIQIRLNAIKYTNY